jgi:hypothetical protein
MVKKKKWIQGAIKNRGSFSEWCKRQGYEGATKECIEKGKRSSNPTTRRRAHLAETLKRLSKKCKKG